MTESTKRVVGRIGAGTGTALPVPLLVPDTAVRVRPAGQGLRLATLTLLVVLGALGPHATVDLRPSYFPNFYFMLVALAFVPALMLLVRWWQRGVPAATAMVAFVLAWLVWAPLSTLWSPDPAAGNQQVWEMSIALAGGICLLGLAGGRLDGVRALRVGWIVAFCVTGLIALWELLTERHLNDGPWAVHGEYVVTSTFYNPNNYAGFLLSCLPYLVWGAVSARSALTRQAHVVLLLCWFALEVGTQSRTGMIGGIVAAPLVVVWLTRSAALRTRPLAVPLLYTVVGAALLLWLGAGTSSGLRLVDGFQSPFLHDPDTVMSDEMRLNLSRLGWRIFIDSGGVGRGAGAFEAMAGKESVLELSGLVNAHNSLLELAADFGLPVLLPLLVVIAAAVWGAVTVRVPSPLRAQALDLRMVILLSVLGFLASSLASSSLLSWPWWWLLLGQIATLSWQLHRMGAVQTGQREDRRRDSATPPMPGPTYDGAGAVPRW